MKVKNIKDIVLWLDQLKKYIDLQNQEIVKLIPQNKEEEFNLAIQELNRKLLEVQSNIPSVPDIPQPPDLSPIKEALSKLQDEVNSIQPNVTNVTEVTQVIKEEIDTDSIFQAFSNTIADVKQEILNLIPEVKDYSKDIEELDNKIKKIKDTPIGMTSIHRGATKLEQLDVDKTNRQDGYILKYNATTQKHEYLPDDEGLPAGADSQVQFNSGGVFSASADFTYDYTNGVLRVNTTNNQNAKISVLQDDFDTLTSGVPTRSLYTAATFTGDTDTDDIATQAFYNLVTTNINCTNEEEISYSYSGFFNDVTANIGSQTDYIEAIGAFPVGSVNQVSVGGTPTGEIEELSAYPTGTRNNINASMNFLTTTIGSYEAVAIGTENIVSGSLSNIGDTDVSGTYYGTYNRLSPSSLSGLTVYGTYTLAQVVTADNVYGHYYNGSGVNATNHYSWYSTRGQAFFQTGTPTIKGVVIKGAASQSANLLEVQNSSGTALSFIRKDGSLKPASLADSAAVNDSIYYSTTAGKLVYKDSSGTVNNLY